VRGLQSAVRARYREADWLDVLQPISDELRDLQRDALVAFALQELSGTDIDTPDKLFEHLLMDVEMEPCMQTSRIRHALSSVQLFIERCLMNLELEVPLSAYPERWDSIRVQWPFMKRYRVWQANREVFLWPENWLDEGLRDDASPIFKETMTELLRGDITEDGAASAMLNYLSKLEEVAKLEPCGMYHEDADAATKKGPVDHVVARTTGAHRKYFYRRFDSTSWSPWEQIKVDFEPAIPVVWNNRLLVFGLRIQQDAPLTAQVPKPSGTDGPLSGLRSQDIPMDTGTIAAKAVLCWSEYYNGKWQPTKTSNVSDPVILGSYGVSGVSEFDPAKLQLASAIEDIYKDAEGTQHQALRIIVRGGTEGNPSFLLYNMHSALPSITFEADSPELMRVFTISHPEDKAALSIQYVPTDAQLQGGYDTETIEVIQEANFRIPMAAVQPLQDRIDSWVAPFLVTDSRYDFYVTSARSGEVSITDSSQPPFGVFVNRNYAQFNTPGLVLPPDGGDPGPMRVQAPQAANIRVGLARSGTVRFGTLTIGAAGAVGASIGEGGAL
jgi:hypothetical protein